MVYITCGILISIGLFCLWMGLDNIRKLYRMKTYTAKTQAEIIEIKHIGRKKKTSYYPIFSYQVQDNIYEYEYDQFSKPNMLQLHQLVEIAYDEVHPQRMVVPTDYKSVLKEALLYTIIPILMIIFGIYVILFT